MDNPLSTTLYMHYDRLSAALFEERQNTVMSLKTADEAEKYIAAAKQKIEKIFALPERPEPESRITGSFRANGTLVDKILFRCADDRWCSGWFIRREQQERMPGMLFVCGHSNDGKFSSAYQIAAFGLALKGFAVLLTDPIGQGEMSQFKDDFSPTWQHNMLGRFCTLDGTTLASYFVHDAQCAIDTLLARPEVLPGPVSVTGNSGGGQLSYYLHALDDRIGFSAPSCHMNNFRTLFRNEQATDAESSPVGLLAAGCDRPDFGIIGAPKPMLLIEQDNDFIDIRGFRIACGNIRHVYELLGHSDDFEVHIGHGNHGFILNGREAAYGFFTRRVLGREDAKEPEGIVPVSPETGNVAPNGKVIDVPGVKSLPQLHLERWKNTVFTSDPLEISAYLKQTLQVDTLTPEVPDYRVLRHVYKAEGGVCGRWAWNTDRNSPAAAVLFKMNEAVTTLIPAVENARLVIAENSSAEELSVQDKDTFFLDMRGIGASRSGAGPVSGSYTDIFGREYFLDNSGRLMDDLLAGGGIRDILSALALLCDAGCREMILAGCGHAGLMIAYAAAMGPLPGVVKIDISDVPESFTSDFRDLRSPVFLPGMMKHFDLPQLYRTLRHYHKDTSINGICGTN